MNRPKRVNLTGALEPTPHCVEWAASRDNENWEVAYFSSSDEVRKFAEAKADTGQSVFLCEIGEYDGANGQTIRTWLYHWWNLLADDTTPPEKGTGYLYGGEGLIAYRPLVAEH